MKRSAPFLMALLIAGALAACGRAPPPPSPPSPPSPPPAPTATAVPDSGGGGQQALAPMDRAKAVEGQVMDNKEDRDKQMEAQSN